MTGVHRAIEDQVRRYPDQWLWFHDRWKAARKRQEPSRAG
jgi:lauroyl/myristoyl acyltransferase